jgi:hypothetical protein
MVKSYAGLRSIRHSVPSNKDDLRRKKNISGRGCRFEARTVTGYLTHAVMDSRGQRNHRHAVKLAASEHHGRLVNDFEKASDYHKEARELASEATGHDPKFTDKEKINLEIYAGRQNDAAERERYLELARGESHTQDREVASSRSR